VRNRGRLRRPPAFRWQRSAARGDVAPRTVSVSGKSPGRPGAICERSDIRGVAHGCRGRRGDAALPRGRAKAREHGREWLPPTPPRDRRARSHPRAGGGGSRSADPRVPMRGTGTRTRSSGLRRERRRSTAPGHRLDGLVERPPRSAAAPARPCVTPWPVRPGIERRVGKKKKAG